MKKIFDNITDEELIRYDLISPALKRIERLPKGRIHCSSCTSSRISKLRYQQYWSIAELFTVTLMEEIWRYVKDMGIEIDDLFDNLAAICNKWKSIDGGEYDIELKDYIERAWRIVFDVLSKAEE